MADDRWKKVTAKTAREIVGPGTLEPDSAELLDAEIPPESFIRTLVEKEKLQDAVKVMTRALPPREAVWWACVCARKMAALAEDKVETEAIEAAEAWVYEPSEKNRERAFNVVKDNDSNGAGMMCALAAAFSAGNAPLGQGQHLDLDPGVFSQIVNGVVMVSAAEKKGKAIKDRLRTYLLSGEDIAQGGNGDIKDREG
jgi:hypothetical protein